MTKCSGVGTAVYNRSGPHNLTLVFEGIGKGLPGCSIRLSAATPRQTPIAGGLGALECCRHLVQVPQNFRGRLAGFRYPEPAIAVSKTFRFIPPVDAEVPHDSNG